jgi:HK97 family phage major capsid protein
MDKKMRELLAKIEEKQTAAKGFLEANDTEKAQGCMAEIAELQAQYEIAEKLFKAEQSKVPDGVVEEKKDTAEEADIKAFAGYVRAMVGKTSTPQNITMGNNGAIIPTTIADRIINQVKEICPIFAGVTMFHVKGTLKIPVYGDKTDDDSNAHNINVAFSDEFTELTADVGAFTSVDLGGFLAGALVLIGKSVVNNADIDVVNFIVNEMSRRIAWFLEDKLLNGAEGKNTGALATTNTLVAGSTTAITADKLIELQDKVSSEYQSNACWTMAPGTFTAIKKLKYADGSYMLQPDATLAFPYRLLGKPVYLSDNMPAITSGAKAVLYGDYAALACNMRENISIEVLSEKYATQHALGVVAWFEFDSEIMDNKGLATLVMSNS